MTNHKVHLIDVETLKKRRDADPKLCLIDVREDNEWREGHIPLAHHIPKDNLIQRIAAIAPKHETPIYLHCKGGVRSLTAAHALLDLGYQEIYSVEGGFALWEKMGFPTA
ncbi:MAG: rhodanese-like domain-containing protein [Legionellales bacterium]|nr:rhodanese-like domain-containing protein [Legionellales bacterium]